MKKNRIHYISGRKHKRYQAFLDSCERQMKRHGAMHKKDLIAGATNKEGQPMRCGVPMSRAIMSCLKNDLKGRFVYLGDGVYDLAQRGVIEQ
jgi:acyl-CoA hydrolase